MLLKIELTNLFWMILGILLIGLRIRMGTVRLNLPTKSVVNRVPILKTEVGYGNYKCRTKLKASYGLPFMVKFLLMSKERLEALLIGRGVLCRGELK